jgi:tripartite-type tricarboxylate transporter receptor subunit TctC
MLHNRSAHQVAQGRLQVLTRRSIVAAAVLAPVPAPVGAWPSGTIRIINPFPAGGASDSIARLLQPGLQQRLGVSIVVENKPGASASVGATVVARSPPDGSTWLLTSDTFVVSSLLLNNLPYDVQKDFEPVTMVARGPMVLCASPSRPYRTLSDVVAAAQARPGTLTYATTGIGSNGHLTMAALCQLTDMRLVHVPYRGVAPATNDAVAGHVDMVVSSTASLAPHIESGQLRALVQCGEKRALFLPDTPTAMESGIANFHTYSWFGFFGPSGTPKPIIDRFYREVVASVRDEATTNVLINKYRVEVPLPTPGELRQMIVEELPFWAGIIRDNNIKGGT